MRAFKLSALLPLCLLAAWIDDFPVKVAEALPHPGFLNILRGSSSASRNAAPALEESFLAHQGVLEQTIQEQSANNDGYASHLSEDADSSHYDDTPKWVEAQSWQNDRAAFHDKNTYRGAAVVNKPTFQGVLKSRLTLSPDEKLVSILKSWEAWAESNKNRDPDAAHRKIFELESTILQNAMYYPNVAIGLTFKSLLDEYGQAKEQLLVKHRGRTQIRSLLSKNRNPLRSVLKIPFMGSRAPSFTSSSLGQPSLARTESSSSFASMSSIFTELTEDNEVIPWMELDNPYLGYSDIRDDALKAANDLPGVEAWYKMSWPEILADPFTWSQDNTLSWLKFEMERLGEYQKKLSVTSEKLATFMETNLFRVLGPRRSATILHLVWIHNEFFEHFEIVRESLQKRLDEVLSVREKFREWVRLQNAGQLEEADQLQAQHVASQEKTRLHQTATADSVDKEHNDHHTDPFRDHETYASQVPEEHSSEYNSEHLSHYAGDDGHVGSTAYPYGSQGWADPSVDGAGHRYDAHGWGHY